VNDTTDDKFLGGRIAAHQPTRGFRAGLDAVMLAAAIPVVAGEEVLELGSGAGVASLCLAARVQSATVEGLEIAPDLVELANANAAANGMDGRVTFFAGDALGPPEEVRHPYDHVLCNPPFHSGEGEVSPDVARARAMRDVGQLEDWLCAGLRRTTGGGTFTVILRADRVREALLALPTHGVSIFPLWPRAGVPAKRVILQATNGSMAPIALLHGLVLHDAHGKYTPEADAVLREGAALNLQGRVN